MKRVYLVEKRLEKYNGTEVEVVKSEIVEFDSYVYAFECLCDMKEDIDDDNFNVIRIYKAIYDENDNLKLGEIVNGIGSGALDYEKEGLFIVESRIEKYNGTKEKFNGSKIEVVSKLEKNEMKEVKTFETFEEVKYPDCDFETHDIVRVYRANYDENGDLKISKMVKEEGFYDDNYYNDLTGLLRR